MKNNWLKKSDQSEQLFILLLVFLIGFLGQAVLNYSFQLFSEELNQKAQNSQIENRLGQDIITEIHEIQSQFFQLAAFPNKHLRKIIRQKITDDEQEIIRSLDILNNGGSYREQIDLNLPNKPDIVEYFRFTPPQKNRFSFIRSDMLSKFSEINQKLKAISLHLDELDQLKAENSPLLAAKINQIKLELKFTAPIFDRLKENANQIFYENKTASIQIETLNQQQKAQYQILQISLTLLALFIGLFIFWKLSRNITQSAQAMALAQDYTHDILTSQSNIIVVNDGKNIIDVSGGFFHFFNEFKTIEAFSLHYSCICDMFVEEEGYIHKFKDQNWVHYLITHQDQTHKVKVNHNGTITTFQISAVKSKKYERFIISMFDISENERINKALEIEKDKALHATKAKGEFLANMSHEIRTPMNAILGFISLLKEMPHDQQTTHYLETIDNSSHSLLGIINDILDFSKIESGKLSLDMTQFEPRKEFNITAELFKAKCTEKNLSFITEFSDQLPNGLYSDVLRIKQVLANLISNAIKFTEPGSSITLCIDYDKEHELLSCSVRDEGIGISEEHQAHIFEAFTQAEASTTRKYGGTGLGLAISAKLVEMLGGKLQLESHLGEGSRFFFTIPAKQAELSPQNATPTSHELQFSGRILLVEDNKTNQLLMTAILNKLGVHFDIANDGLEAIEAIQSDDYQLVLMDENMPNLNGIEATKRIRTLEREGQHIPIIALTANAMSGDKESFLAAGMDEYLTKPVNIPKLIKMLQTFCPNNNKSHSIPLS